MFVTIAIGFTVAVPAAPPHPPRAVRETALAAVVRVSDPAAGAVGSGVVVGVRTGYAYVLTAAHVLGPGARPTVEWFAGEKVTAAPDRGEVVFRVAEADVAVVRLPAGRRDWPAIALVPRPAPTDRVEGGWAIGCDNGKPPQVTAVALRGRKLVRRSDAATAFFWEAKEIAPGGRSGGPLLDAAGRVIGLCSGTQERLTYYTHADEIRAAFRKHGLGWATGDDAGGK